MAQVYKSRKAYICASYDHRDVLRPVLDVIEDVLSEFDLTSCVFVLGQENFKTYSSLMESALKEVKKASIVIAEVSYKKIGIGIELGYAYALNKPIIYVRKEGTPVSTTVSGISMGEIVYGSFQELKASLVTEIRACLSK